ncbi:hypothetical protein [Sporisorium scitamineum]|uniref:Uncharacterized protein n=1 Tax=Sporisorium scitamineum TaxID=49012 RepID=A0A0F7RS21_9BASI|nr:hypothetical protein [Sporisorium scitamineum]
MSGKDPQPALLNEYFEDEIEQKNNIQSGTERQTAAEHVDGVWCAN